MEKPHYQNDDRYAASRSVQMTEGRFEVELVTHGMPYYYDYTFVLIKESTIASAFVRFFPERAVPVATARFMKFRIKKAAQSHRQTLKTVGYKALDV